MKKNCYHFPKWLKSKPSSFSASDDTLFKKKQMLIDGLISLVQVKALSCSFFNPTECFPKIGVDKYREINRINVSIAMNYDIVRTHFNSNIKTYIRQVMTWHVA